MNGKWTASLFFYGCAGDGKNKWAQVLVYKTDREIPTEQFFTGKVYRTKAEAVADITALNCGK